MIPCVPQVLHLGQVPDDPALLLRPVKTYMAVEDLLRALVKANGCFRNPSAAQPVEAKASLLANLASILFALAAGDFQVLSRYQALARSRSVHGVCAPL